VYNIQFNNAAPGKYKIYAAANGKPLENEFGKPLFSPTNVVDLKYHSFFTQIKKNKLSIIKYTNL